jgi:hypothetical protein
MNCNKHFFSFLVLTLAALGSCSSNPPASEAKKAEFPPVKLQGKVDVVVDPPGTGDGALNGGGPSLILWEGKHRYRLFSRNTAKVDNGAEYIVEGYNAQQIIDQIGDPAQGKLGYPLLTSCERVVKLAWSGMAFDDVDTKASVLRNRVGRYPARPVILVTRIQAVPTDPKKKAEPEEKEVPLVPVPAEKQRTLLIAAAPAQTAPLWDPAARTVSCKVIVNREGKINELETGAQLCEAVDWSQYRYQPPVRAGHPVEVRTEVVVQFEPRK